MNDIFFWKSELVENQNLLFLLKHFGVQGSFDRLYQMPIQLLWKEVSLLSII